MHMNEITRFKEATYKMLEAGIRSIPDNEVPDIYALSCWYLAQDDEARYPMVILSYNTNSHYQSQIPAASSEAEAKWNYAFWLQNDIVAVGGEDDDHLAAWFAASPYYYSEEQNLDAEEDDALFEQLLEKANAFNDAFIEIIIECVSRLFSEGVISEKFGKHIPVLIHELEYYDKPLEWTTRANPPGVAEEFIRSFAKL